ncbi:hypothetical protein C8R42DRAFT_638935 [Lentinula raphanica]|nr:hypothetical protein C8R42DRAFT_638935 [Lentinula raphanica]
MRVIEQKSAILNQNETLEKLQTTHDGVLSERGGLVHWQSKEARRDVEYRRNDGTADIYINTAEKLNKVENVLEKYKKKLQETDEFGQRVKAIKNQDKLHREEQAGKALANASVSVIPYAFGTELDSEIEGMLEDAQASVPQIKILEDELKRQKVLLAGTKKRYMQEAKSLMSYIHSMGMNTMQGQLGQRLGKTAWLTSQRSNVVSLSLNSVIVASEPQQRRVASKLPSIHFHISTSRYRYSLTFRSQTATLLENAADRSSVTPSRTSLHRENSPGSTTNIPTIVKAQVFLLSTLTENNYEQNALEIRSDSLIAWALERLVLAAPIVSSQSGKNSAQAQTVVQQEFKTQIADLSPNQYTNANFKLLQFTPRPSSSPNASLNSVTVIKPFDVPVPDRYGVDTPTFKLFIAILLDVAQDLEILKALLETSLASRREYPNLDKWLMVNVTNHGVNFLHSVLMFLEDKMIADLQPGTRTMTLKSNTNPIILRMVRNSQTKWQTRTSSSGWMSKTIQVHPRLMSMMHNSDIEPGYTMIAYSAELEAEVNGIYEQMYDENTTIDEVIDMLQRYKNSRNLREHEGWPPDTSWALNCPLRRFSSSSGSKHVLGLNTDYANGDHCETWVQNANIAEAKSELVANLQKELAAIAEWTTGHVVHVPPLDVVNEAVTVPVDEISDKILFIIDDLAPNNFSAQLEGMQVLFKDMYSLRLPS